MDRGRIIESRKDNLIMAISGKPCCVLGVHRARRLSARRNGENHVHPRSSGMARDVRLGTHERCSARHPGLTASARRCRRQIGGPDRRRVHFDVPLDRLALGPANVGHLLGVGRTAHWQDANRMAIGNHALHPVLSFRAEARPHHDLSTGEVLPSDPRCFIPQADEGARATAPTRPDHFPAPSFPTTDRWCYKHRSVPAFVRLLTAASVTLSRDIRHTPISLVFLLRGVICYRLSGGYPLT